MFLDTIQFLKNFSFFFFPPDSWAYRKISVFGDGRFCPDAWTALTIMGSSQSRSTNVKHKSEYDMTCSFLGAIWISHCSYCHITGEGCECYRVPPWVPSSHLPMVTTPSLHVHIIVQRGQWRFKPRSTPCTEVFGQVTLNLNFSSVKWNENTQPLEGMDCW